MALLEETWRWFGPDEPVTLAHVRQAGIIPYPARGIDPGCGGYAPVLGHAVPPSDSVPLARGRRGGEERVQL